MGGWTDEWMMDGWRNKRIDDWMDGWMMDDGIYAAEVQACFSASASFFSGFALPHPQGQ